jgi:hypothetical protein
MIGRLLASAAFAVALSGTALISTAGAQMSAPPPTNPTASPSAGDASHATAAPTSMKPPASTKSMTSRHSAAGSGPSGSGTSATKQTAQGHQQSDVADKLNACENKPLPERQPCIDAATRM